MSKTRTAGPGRLQRLIAIRDKLAAALADGPSQRDLPAISREYRMLLAEIDSINAKDDGPDVVDQLAARRGAKAARRARRTS
jgi:hypothetical protein